MKFQILILASIFLSACANGALRQIYNQLTTEQRQQVEQIFEQNRNATKGQFKSALNNFISTLSTELQSEISQANATFQQRIQENSQRVANLSAAAQSLYSQITAIGENDNLTFQESRQQIEQLLQSADPSVIQEFESNRVFLPGVHPSHSCSGQNMGVTGNPFETN
ncbi:unnamed protein product [Bursaphelenchus xylophilus]|uniref:(pine wood nematode) hypothetical protein n=1 Tax=Bursaphelenchus xylophilus TaxID=6326 RepID=A0A1I7RV77_BURXY|nr:unnamed protein product [Bursaphelenchus xylophilus]CAG9124685.1 unnamed protein product [Bursaphelenchus xylophilus]